MSETLKGVVKWFNDAKGFGFIEHSSGRDVFVHFSVIEAEGFKTLKDGEEVLYEIKEGPKGLHAARVQRDPRNIQPRKSSLKVERITTETQIVESDEMMSAAIMGNALGAGQGSGEEIGD